MDELAPSLQRRHSAYLLEALHGLIDLAVLHKQLAQARQRRNEARHQNQGFTISRLGLDDFSFFYQHMGVSAAGQGAHRGIFVCGQREAAVCRLAHQGLGNAFATSLGQARPQRDVVGVFVQGFFQHGHGFATATTHLGQLGAEQQQRQAVGQPFARITQQLSSIRMAAGRAQQAHTGNDERFILRLFRDLRQRIVHPTQGQQGFRQRLAGKAKVVAGYRHALLKMRQSLAYLPHTDQGTTQIDPMGAGVLRDTGNGVAQGGQGLRETRLTEKNGPRQPGGVCAGLRPVTREGFQPAFQSPSLHANRPSHCAWQIK